MKKPRASHSPNSNKNNLSITSRHAAEVAIEAGFAKELLYSPGVAPSIVELAKQKGIFSKEITRNALQQLNSEASRHFVLKARPPAEISLQSLFSRPCDDAQGYKVLLLDHIFDPHNLGAIFRTAVEFSIDLLLFPRNRSAMITETVCAVSVGAVFLQPYCSIPGSMQILKQLADKGFTIVGTTMDGYPLDQYSFSKHTVLVLGSEGRGISDAVKKKCHHIVSIPANRRLDSLNVSVAAGICMYAMHTASLK